MRQSWGVDSDGPACLYVGRVAAEKNLALVKKTFAAIQVWHPNAKMIWVGDGPSAKQLAADHPDHHFAGMRIGEAIGLDRDDFDADRDGLPALVGGGTGVTYQRLEVDAHAFQPALDALARERGYVEHPQRALDVAERLGEMAEAARQTMLPRSWAGVVETFENVAREAMATQP